MHLRGVPVKWSYSPMYRLVRNRTVSAENERPKINRNSSGLFNKNFNPQITSSLLRKQITNQAL